MSRSVCVYDGAAATARTLCRKHYDQMRREGRLDRFAVLPRQAGPFSYAAWREQNRERIRAYNRDWMRRYRARGMSEQGDAGER